MPCEEHSLKGHCCVSLCSFMCVTACVCVHPSSAFNLQWLYKFVCVCLCGPDWRISVVIADQNRTSQWSEALREECKWEWKKECKRERESKGVEEKHEVIRGTFTSSVPWPLSPSLSLALCLSLFLSLSHSLSCGLCLFIIFFSQWPFPPHSPGSLNKRRRAIVWQLWGLSYEFPHTYTHYTFLLSVRGHFLPNYQVLCT